MPQPPAKKLRLSTSAAYDNVPGIHEQRRQAELKLKSRFDAIYEKYDRDFTGIGDVIDMQTGELVVDNGHLRNMRHDRDIGVSVLRPAPILKKPNTRRGKKAEVVKPSKVNAVEEHDELSSPMPRAVEEVEEIPIILPAEGRWAKPEELNDPIPPVDSPAYIASRVNLLATPGVEQLDLTKPEHLARFTQNIIAETIRQQQILSSVIKPRPTSLPTPPASERAMPVEPIMSVWAEFEDEESGDDYEPAGSILVGDEPHERGTLSRRPFSPEDDNTLLRMRDQDKMSFGQIESYMGRRSGTLSGRYRRLKAWDAQPSPQPVQRRTSRSSRSQKDDMRMAMQAPIVNSPGQAPPHEQTQESPGSTATRRRGRSRRSLPLHPGAAVLTESNRPERHSDTEGTRSRRSARLSGMKLAEETELMIETKTSKPAVTSETATRIVADSFEAEEAPISSSVKQADDASSIDQSSIPSLYPRHRGIERHKKTGLVQPSTSTMNTSHNIVEHASRALNAEIDSCEATAQLLHEITASEATEEELEVAVLLPSPPRDNLRRTSARFSHVEIPLLQSVRTRPVTLSAAQKEAHGEPLPQLEDNANLEGEVLPAGFRSVTATKQKQQKARAQSKRPTSKNGRRAPQPAQETSRGRRTDGPADPSARSTPARPPKIKSSPRSPRGVEAPVNKSANKPGHEITYRAIPMEDDGSDDELGDETMHCDSILGA